MASSLASTGRNAAQANATTPRKSKAQFHIDSRPAEPVKPTATHKETLSKTSTATKSATQTSILKEDASTKAPSTNKPRRKPRKLNKEAASDPQPASLSVIPDASTLNEADSELAALKSRVRGLEAKVEELYKTGVDARSARSPRRRGKGRKTSSSNLDTNANMIVGKNAKVQEIDDEEEAADEELDRLESELEVARQDLDSFHPRMRRTTSQGTDDVEEIPRHDPRAGSTGGASDRQVTLSGSYRIPIPANVSVEDVKNIKSGVSAAQNVARTFLEQRRAAAALRAEENLTTSRQSTTAAPDRPTRNPNSRAASSTLDIAVENTGDKQSWGDWIGGYSMAITRAMKTIEHEAAMENRRAINMSGSVQDSPKRTEKGNSSSGTKRTTARRPPAKGSLSSELLS